MNQIDVLRELAVKVEAGGHVATQFFEACWKTGFGWGYNACNEGSLDSAHLLHKAVLGYYWDFENFTVSGDVCLIKLRPLERVYAFVDMNPARAWLLAIIKAKIAELETQENDDG